MMNEINLNNYGVARKELFSPREDVRITFNKGRIYVNQYGVGLMPEVDYIRILVNRNDKTLVILPSQYGDKDSIKWVYGRDRLAKKIKAIPLSYLILKLMDWNPNCRYVVIGQLYKTNKERMLFFKLDEAVCYEEISEIEEEKNKSKANYPKNWEINFGAVESGLDPINGIRVFDKEMVFEEEIIIQEAAKLKMQEVREKMMKEEEQDKDDYQ